MTADSLSEIAQAPSPVDSQPGAAELHFSTGRYERRLPLVLTVTGPPESGEHKTEVHLPVNGEVREKVPLMVTVQSAPPVRLVEQEVFFGMVGKDKQAEKRVELRVREGVEVRGLTVESSPDYIEVELVGEDEDERPPAVKFTLLPVEEGGPFSSRLELGLRYDQRTAEMAVKCYGIRSR